MSEAREPARAEAAHLTNDFHQIQHNGGFGLYGSIFTGTVNFNAFDPTVAHARSLCLTQDHSNKCPSEPSLRDLDARLRSIEQSITTSNARHKPSRLSRHRPFRIIKSNRKLGKAGLPTAQSDALTLARRLPNATVSNDQHLLTLVRAGILVYESRGVLVRQTRTVIDTSYSDATPETKQRMVTQLGQLRLLLWLLQPSRVACILRRFNARARTGASSSLVDIYYRGPHLSEQLHAHKALRRSVPTSDLGLSPQSTWLYENVICQGTKELPREDWFSANVDTSMPHWHPFAISRSEFLLHFMAFEYVGREAYIPVGLYAASTKLNGVPATLEPQRRRKVVTRTVTYERE